MGISLWSTTFSAEINIFPSDVKANCEHFFISRKLPVVSH